MDDRDEPQYGPHRTLVGDVAIVTGATGGIGQAIAHELAAHGASVVVTGRRQDAGDEVARSIREQGGEATFVRADLAVDDDVAALVGATVQRYGSVSVLVNNAAPTDLVGPGNIDGRLTDVPPAQFEVILRSGLWGAYLCCYHAIPHMCAGGGGSIVNISSVSGVKAVPRVFGYATAKGGLQALTRCVAADYADDGIRANSVIVGFVISNPLAQRMADNPAMRAAMAATHLTRFGEPIDIARITRFLASDEGAFISGTELYADGGNAIKQALPATKRESEARYGGGAGS